LAFETFTQNKDFKLLFSERNGEIIGALLLFYYKDMVEYYTPAFKLEYSGLQPLSMLIFEGMKDAVKNAYTMWNFGGTWHSQQGVLKFKRSWGPRQSSYYYYINCYQDSDSIRSLPAETFTDEYKWFYVIPFSCLKASRK
jgi:lipid II:glycine glycyltransferase (peptidoglycan interpeptide bridge formation enzyme)